MVNDFFYKQPVRIWFGEGKFQQLESVMAELGCKKCVLVCGRHFAPEAKAMMEKMPAIAAVYGEVEQNPQLAGVEETVRLARSLGADTIVGIGGGSSMDTAKFAAAAAPGTESAEAYYTGAAAFPGHPLTIIAVPTTAGTGAEVTQVSVMSRGSEKRTINNPLFMPTAAIVDPALTMTVPPRTTMNTGLDALAHALEGFWSVNHQPIADLFAVEAVRIIMENLETAWRDGSNKEARGNMLYASLLAGLAFSNPRTAGCHGCSYPLSEDYHLPHGEACAFTLDSFVRINADERLEALCRKAGLSGTGELAQRIAALKQLAGLRTKLSDLGEVDMDKLCHDCAVHVLMNNNPVKMDEAALREMFEKLK